MAKINPENNQQGRRSNNGVHRPRCSSASFLEPKCQNLKERNGVGWGALQAPRRRKKSRGQSVTSWDSARSSKSRDAAAEAAGTGSWEGTGEASQSLARREDFDGRGCLSAHAAHFPTSSPSPLPTEHTHHPITLQVKILPAFEDLLKYNVFHLKPFSLLSNRI